VDISQLTKAVAELARQISIVDLAVCVGGSSVLAVWLLKTSFGTKALVDSPPRRNNMPSYLAVIPLFMWIVVVMGLVFIKKKALGGLSDWQSSLADNVIICIGVVPAVATSMIIARSSFARRLKGFGLNPKTIVRDFGAGFLNLLATMPVVLAVVILTTLIGKLVVGGKFEMPQHAELKEIMAYQQWQVRALIIFTTILVVPLAEEIFFRGMFQTMLRSYIVRPANRPGLAEASRGGRGLAFGGPWPAIILASLVFVMFHENPEHWPALFALSVCLGYSYEKSGSLFRPIFIHSMFNALSVFAALGQ
jgi:membrane protease YdiL (CAAX protease family)